MIPHTFDEWRACIVHQCGIPLTAKFAEERLAVYKNAAHPETRKFVQCYGPEHLQSVIHWYERFV